MRLLIGLIAAVHFRANGNAQLALLLHQEESLLLVLAVHRGEQHQLGIGEIELTLHRSVPAADGTVNCPDPAPHPVTGLCAKRRHEGAARLE